MCDTTSVEVALRVRPLVPNEISKGSQDVIEVLTKLNQVRVKGSEKAFTYNYVFDSDTEQENFYNDCVGGIIGNLFKGYNVTILAYGQTGSGKTHSMGTAYTGDEDMGVIPRAVNDIFNFVSDNFTYDFTITVSFMELYQEVLYDLLTSKPRDQCSVEIREDNKYICIPGLSEHTVTSASEALECLSRGSKGRATSSTNMNAQSSRSHAIFTINIGMQKKDNSNLNKTAKFHLVDLAGSERSKKTGATGQTFKEGVNINKGLLALGNVISALGDEKTQNGYISYRDSNLTRLLKDSLGGNSITLMIACVSPADYNLEETLSTLRYADRARKIKNKPVINQDPKAAEINRLNKLVQQLRLGLVGQDGAMMCEGEFELLKKEVSDLRLKNRELNVKLSMSVTNNTVLFERVLLMQTANEALIKKIQELGEDYNVTLNNLNMSVERNDIMGVKENMSRLENIHVCLANINSEQLKNIDDIRKHEAFAARSTQVVDPNSECEINDRQETHNTQQMALTSELQEVTEMLVMKEHLLEQIAANNGYPIDYTEMAECKTKIEALESEKTQLLQQLKTAHVPGPINKIAEQRRKRLQELESQIQGLHKKVTEQGRLIKMKEKDEVKLKQLNSEITGMKQAKVKLIKKMREESDKFRSWKMDRERDFLKLKEQDRKKENKIVKMETVHSRQQMVWKRKVEEAAAANKRLKVALERRQAAQHMKYSGKIERIGHWIKHELEIHVNIMETKMMLGGLLEDRANLHEHLELLKAEPETDGDIQVEELEHDIQLRSVQIQDLQQKLLDFDEDNSTVKLDNIQTMTEAKYALKTLFELVADIKKSSFNNENKIQELENSIEDLNKRHNRQTDLLKQKDMEHFNSVREYEDKISLLLRRLKPSDVESQDDGLKKLLEMQQQQIENLQQENEDLRTQSQQVSIENIKYEPILSEISINTRKKSSKTSDQECDIEVDLVDCDLELSYNDDVTDDPDWRNTPLAKRIQKMKNTSKPDPEDRLKRSSEGGCTCKGNCSTRNCGCRKTSNTCALSCKCKEDNCVNRDVKESDDQQSSKKPKLEFQDENDQFLTPTVIKKKRSKMFNDV